MIQKRVKCRSLVLDGRLAKMVRQLIGGHMVRILKNAKASPRISRNIDKTDFLPCRWFGACFPHLPPKGFFTGHKTIVFKTDRLYPLSLLIRPSLGFSIDDYIHKIPNLVGTGETHFIDDNASIIAGHKNRFKRIVGI